MNEEAEHDARANAYRQRQEASKRNVLEILSAVRAYDTAVEQGHGPRRDAAKDRIVAAAKVAAAAFRENAIRGGGIEDLESDLAAYEASLSTPALPQPGGPKPHG